MADHDMTCGPALSSNMPVGQSGRAVENSPKVGFSVGVVEWNVDGGVDEPRLLWTKQCDRSLGQLQDVSRATLGPPTNHGSLLVPNCRGDPFVSLTSATGAPWCLFRHVSGVPRLICCAACIATYLRTLRYPSRAPLYLIRCHLPGGSALKMANGPGNRR